MKIVCVGDLRERCRPKRMDVFRAGCCAVTIASSALIAVSRGHVQCVICGRVARMGRIAVGAPEVIAASRVCRLGHLGRIAESGYFVMPKRRRGSFRWSVRAVVAPAESQMLR